MSRRPVHAAVVLCVSVCRIVDELCKGCSTSTNAKSATGIKRPTPRPPGTSVAIINDCGTRYPITVELQMKIRHYCKGSKPTCSCAG